MKKLLPFLFAMFAFSSAIAELIQPPHPTIRTSPAPTNSEPADVNPPSLLWPLAKGSKVRYAVRLSQSRNFTGKVFEATNLRWGIYNPHYRLESGKWYWQYAVKQKHDKKQTWSNVFQFSISDELRTFVTPPSSNMLAAAHKLRPRIPVKPALADKNEMQGLINRAEQLLKKPIPSIDKAAPKEQGKNKFEQTVFARVASKEFSETLCNRVKKLMWVYQITGDECYGSKAVEYGLFVAGLDIDGVTAAKFSDFADGNCMQVLARVYDGCYDLMTPQQKQQLRSALLARTSRFFQKTINNLEAKVFSAHIWQRILAQTTEGALTLIGDVPDAENWLAYVYELWIAKFPNLSRTDGAWANGISYLRVNFLTMLDIPTLFGQLTGGDFFNHPWYRNVPYYLMYCWPPDSVSDGFCDGSNRSQPLLNSYGTFALELGKHFKNPYALWYAQKILGKLDDPPVTPKPPADLPSARIFTDVGIVTMHTDLIDATRNLMIAFRSSPYGAFNHMHRDQNSFNLNYGGEPLFRGSGDYISYGDDHYKEWYNHTRGHNSIMIDGKGQMRGSEGFGRIIDYKHSTASTYCVGDASHAYGDDVGLRIFRRHLLFLRPGVLLVYDELEAGHKAQWEWMLHSLNKLTIDNKVLMGGNKKAKTRVDFFASSQLTMNIHTRYDPPAVNWRKKKNSKGKIIEYPDQWHFSAVSAVPQEKLRILAVIQVRPANNPTPMDTPQMQGDIVSLSGKQVQVELSTDSPARIHLR